MSMIHLKAKSHSGPLEIVAAQNMKWDVVGELKEGMVTNLGTISWERRGERFTILLNHFNLTVDELTTIARLLNEVNEQYGKDLPFQNNSHVTPLSKDLANEMMQAVDFDTPSVSKEDAPMKKEWWADFHEDLKRNKKEIKVNDLTNVNTSAPRHIEVTAPSQTINRSTLGWSVNSTPTISKGMHLLINNDELEKDLHKEIVAKLKHLMRNDKDLIESIERCVYSEIDKRVKMELVKESLAARIERQVKKDLEKVMEFIKRNAMSEIRQETKKLLIPNQEELEKINRKTISKLFESEVREIINLPPSQSKRFMNDSNHEQYDI